LFGERVWIMMARDLEHLVREPSHLCPKTPGQGGEPTGTGRSIQFSRGCGWSHHRAFPNHTAAAASRGGTRGARGLAPGMYRLIVWVLTTFRTRLFIFFTLVEFDSSVGGGGGSSDMTRNTRFITDSSPSFCKTVLSRSINQTTSVWGRSRPLQVDPLFEVQRRRGIEVRTEFFDTRAIAVSVKTTVIEEFIQDPYPA
jgi:hypothetical protein